MMPVGFLPNWRENITGFDFQHFQNAIARRGDFHFSQLGVQFSELGARLSNALGPRARQQQIVATFGRRDVFFESARAGHCLLALGW